MDRHGRVLRGAAWSGEVRQGYLIKIMSGITTSETLAGEQPKNDNLGGRVDELERVMTGLERSLNDFLSRIEALENKNDDEEQL